MSVHVEAELPPAELYCPACEASFASGTACPTDGTRLVTLVIPTDSLVGRDIDGRFTILERLGQGGMGAVYRANQHSVGREVAIKVVHANLASDQSVIKRFLREARLASKLSHPNAVGVLDFGQTADGLFYLVMELVSGRTLARVFEEDGPFDARRLIRIGMQICEALEAAHQLSIIHRDLKPANIMILDTGRDLVKVLDFGLAKSTLGETPSEMTGSNGLMGTPAYMPPERAIGGSGDARSDLYSLGCMLYLLGSGVAPFDSENIQELLLKQVVSSAPPMVGVPFALATVIDRLLLKSPDLRYQTAAETREALDDVLADLPALPRRGTTQPSVPVLAVDEVDDDAVAEVAVASSGALDRMVREDTLLAPTPSSPLPIPHLRSRWPWVVAMVAVVIAIGTISFGGDSTPAAAAKNVDATESVRIDKPVVVMPLPMTVTPADVPSAVAPAGPPKAVPASSPGQRPTIVAPARKPTAPRKPQGPQFPF